MRKIFPLKPAARANDTSTTSSSSRKATPSKSRSASFSGFQERVQLADASCGSNSLRRQDAPEESARVKREHWCPACAAPGSDAKCATPPSGDENLATLEEIKTLLVAKNEAAGLSFLHRHGLQGDSSTFGRRLDTAASSSSSHQAAKGLLVGLPRVSSSGRGNDLLVAPVAESDTVSASAARAAAAADMSARNGNGAKSDKRSSRSRMLPLALRSSSAPKTRQPTPSSSSSSVAQLSGQPSARHNSMRYSGVPDRVFSAETSSPKEKAQLNADPLEQRPSGRSATAGRTRVKSPGVESAAVSDADATRALHARSLSETEWLPSTSVSPKLDSSKLRNGSSDKPQSRYLSARTVAERLARAIRGSTRSWSKDVKAFVPPSQGPENTRRAGEADGSPVSRIQGGEHSLSTTTTDSTPKAPSASSDGAGQSAPGSAGGSDETMLEVQQFDAKDSLEWPDSSTDSRGGRSQTPESCGSKTGVERTALLAELGKSLEAQLEKRNWPTDAAPPSRSSWPLSLLQEDANRMSPRLASYRVEQSGRMTPAGYAEASPRLITVHADEAARESPRSWSNALGRTSEPMGEDLEVRFRVVQDQVSMLAGEKALLEDQFDLLTEDSMEWRLKMQQRLRRMHEEKKHLAQEVAAEVKRRMTERVAAKEVLGMMKKEMESCMKLMEKEKFDTQISLEQELERRETTWGSRMEKIQAEESWLRDRLKNLEEEKGGLQQELVTVNSKENALREKVSEFENQMDSHRKRVEGAEKTILDLRKSLDDSFQHSRQTEADLELLRKACKEKDGENSDLHKHVQRLQQLCQDHEKSIHGLRQAMKNASDKSDDGDARVRRLQKELIRLSGVEQALRSELEASRGEATVLRRDNRGLLERLRSDQREAALQMKKSEADYRLDVDRLQSQIVELGQDNNILAGKLRVVLREREEAKDALKVSESCMKGVEEQNRSLQDDIRRERLKIHEMQQDYQEFSRLEKRAESLAKHNQMLQTLLSMKEKAVLASGEEVKEKEHQVREAQQSQSEMRQSLQVSARQLYIMNERVEIMANKLLERESQIVSVRKECEQREEVIQGLEQNLSELAKQVDSQNARIQRLTGNNEELFRLYHEKGREIEELQQKLLKEIEGKLECEQEIEQLKETIKDLKNEVKSQELNCKVLRDKLFSREADIEENNKEVSLLVQRRDWLQNELQQCKKLHSDAARRVELLDHQVKEMEGQIAALQADAESRLKELTTLREVVPRITKERDSMQEEAEEMGREALRMSAEVEVLRRKVQQLDEDVMVKEGQISILRGNYEAE